MRASVALVTLSMAGVAGAVDGGAIIFLAPKGAPTQLSSEQFLREFSRESLATSRRRLEIVPIDLFDVPSLEKQVDAVVARRPKLIVAPATRAASILKARTASIPILFVCLPDPVAVGLISDKRSPQENLTGFTYAAQAEAKHFEMATEILAGGKSVGLIVDVEWPRVASNQRLLESVQKEFGVLPTVVAQDDFESVRTAALTPAGRAVKLWIVPDTALARSAGRDVTRLLLGLGAIIITERRELLAEGAHVLMEPDIERPLKVLAEMADLILAGVPINKVPIARPKRFTTHLNMASIAKSPWGQWKKLILNADGFYP